MIVGNAYAPFFRVNSIFWDPSIYGRYLTVGILTALAGDPPRRRPRAGSSPGSTPSSLAMWVGLFFSFSQSSFVALAVGVLVAARSSSGGAWPSLAIVVLAVLVRTRRRSPFRRCATGSRRSRARASTRSRATARRSSARGSGSRSTSGRRASASEASGGPTPSGPGCRASGRRRPRRTRRRSRWRRRRGLPGLVLFGWLSWRRSSRRCAGSAEASLRACRSPWALR